MTQRMKIRGAWFVGGRAIGTRPGKAPLVIGHILARSPEDKIYRLNNPEGGFVSPADMVKAIQVKGDIDPTLWTCTADDSEAVRYFDSHRMDPWD